MVKILTANSSYSYEDALKQLEDKINDYMNKGWELYGDLIMLFDSRQPAYIVTYTIIKK